MHRFESDPHEFFEAVYSGVVPWDIGAAQPDMVALLAELPPDDPVLDAGCGSGDLAIHLARAGFHVLGIDFVESAIERARAKAGALPSEIAARLEFAVTDARMPSKLGRRFGAVVDSGFLHVLTPEQGTEYLADIATILRPGGRYYLHAFATEFPIPNTPRQITESEVQERFAEVRGWRIRALRSGEFQSTIAPVPATLACAERRAVRGSTGVRDDGL